MAQLANLSVLLSLDSGQFIDGLRSAQKEGREAERAFKPLTATLKDFGAGAKSVGVGLTAAVTVPLTAIGSAAVAAGISFDEGMDTIRTGTGATGDALKRLGGDFKTVLTQVPNDIGEVATAIADLNTRTGLAGQPLQELATHMLNLARITKTDVGEAVATTTRVFGDWGIATDKQNTTLDFLFKTTQSTGIGLTSLSSKIVQFGAPLRQMGFDFETSAAMLGKFEKEGVNTELVMGSLRIALTRMAKEGVTDAGEALGTITQRIKDAGSAGEANRIALEVFGARAGPDMAAAIREGRFEIGNLVADLKSSGETINAAAKETLSFGESMALMKNKTLVALEPLGAKLLDVFDKTALPLMEKLITAVSGAIDWFNKLPAPVQNIGLALAGAATLAGPLLIFIGQAAIGLSGLIPIGAKVIAMLSGAGGLSAGFLAVKAVMVSLTATVFPAFVAALPILAIVAAGVAVYKTVDAFIAWRDAVKNAERADSELQSGLAGSIAKLKEQGVHIDATGKSAADLTQEVATAHQTLAWFKQRSEEAGKAQKGLKVEIDAAKTSSIESIDALVKQVSATDALRKSQDPLVRQYAELTPMIQGATSAYESQRETLKNLAAVKRSLADVAILSSELPSLGVQRPNVDPSRLPTAQTVKHLEDLDKLKKVPAEVAETIRQMQAAGKSNGEIIAVMGGEIKRAADASRQFGIELDPATKAILKQIDATEASARKAEDWRRIWQNAMGNVVSDFSKSVTNMIFEGGKFSTNLIGIFKDLGKSIVQMFITDVFTSLAKGFSGLLSDMTGQLGGFVKSIPGIGGLFGGGADAAASTAGSAASTAGSTATNAAGQAASMSVAGAVNMVSGVAAAIGSIAGAIGTMRLEGTMNAVEYNTRASMLSLTYINENLLRPIMGTLHNLTWDIVHPMSWELGSIGEAVRDIRDNRTIDALGAVTPDRIVQAAPAQVSLQYQAGDIHITTSGDDRRIRSIIVEAAEANTETFTTRFLEAMRRADAAMRVVTA